MLDMDALAGWIADLLRIDRPVIELADELHTTTQIAELLPDLDRLRVRRSASDADRAFAIAHEMRHAWQQARAPQLLAGYRQAADLTPEAYNRQPAEIDANAFALIVLTDLFHIRPLFRGLDAQTRQMIEARAELIAKNPLRT